MSSRNTKEPLRTATKAKESSSRSRNKVKSSAPVEGNRLKTLETISRLQEAAKSMKEDEKVAVTTTAPKKGEESKTAQPKQPPMKEALPDYDPLEHIPEEYRKHGVDTEPILHYIREKSDEEELEALLEAAQRDVRLHQARIRAAALNNPALLAEYDFTQDSMYISRQERKQDRMTVVEKLSQEARTILRELDEDKKNLTPAERTQVKLARWQRALELYVYCPSEMSLDLLGLLEKLLDGTSEVREELMAPKKGISDMNISLTTPYVHRSKNYPKYSQRLPACVHLWWMRVNIRSEMLQKMRHSLKMLT